MKSIVSLAIYIYLSGPILAQIVAIIDGDHESHLDHYRILSQQSVSGRDEHIRTYMRVPHRPKSGTLIVIVVSGLHPIVDPIRTIISNRI